MFLLAEREAEGQWQNGGTRRFSESNRSRKGSAKRGLGVAVSCRYARMCFDEGETGKSTLDVPISKLSPIESQILAHLLQSIVCGQVLQNASFF